MVGDLSWLLGAQTSWVYLDKINGPWPATTDSSDEVAQKAGEQSVNNLLPNTCRSPIQALTKDCWRSL